MKTYKIYTPSTETVRQYEQEMNNRSRLDGWAKKIFALRGKVPLIYTPDDWYTAIRTEAE